MPTVLIIDDEKAIRNTLKEILEYENFKVEEEMKRHYAH